MTTTEDHGAGAAGTVPARPDPSGERPTGHDQDVPGGVVHALPADLREALTADAAVLAAWRDITPLARNEFICWVDDAKQQATRQRRIRRTGEELAEGMRRPCCWPGCAHRERTGR
ncbi:YdeI/OmpD-associated family protein [Kocuria sp. LUK]|uniref:YdeI/OmpD-associated family protein n=1 Tax=Kocuria TaxID=57493 RepID=UPI000DD37770|nr:YdeI/OmpD-associated family protein [Kocuria sp. LUK]MCD1145370.1 YdeI/OmpD-associated family protein [Kocuria sp. LUK]